MKGEELKLLEKEELKSLIGGVAPGPNGETCTEHGLPDLLKSKPFGDILKQTKQ